MDQNNNYDLKKIKLLLKQHGDFYEKVNLISLFELFDSDKIDSISKSITHYAFRNGPVEDMHANNQLSENDMKTLNIFMTNRIAGLLTAIADNKWFELDQVYKFYKIYGTDWDKAIPDTEEIDSAIDYMF